MRRCITICLFVALITSMFSGCGNGQTADPIQGETTTDTTTAESITETESETERQPALPDVDYEGYDFRLMTYKDNKHFMFAEEQTGEPVNDAVFQSRIEVEERFNVKITNPIEVTTSIGSLIKAGEDAYDLGMDHDRTAATNSLSGYFHNIYDIPHLEFDGAWWPQFALDSLTINHKMFYMSNYLEYFALYETRAVFVNLDHLKDFGMEDPYEIVYNGDWTIDRMQEITKDVYQDVDGNGTRDVTDVYGFFFLNDPYSWLEGFGVELYQKEGPDSANITLAANTEKCTELVTKLHNWLYNGAVGVYCDFSSKDSSMEMFASGSGVYTIKRIGDQLKPLMETDMQYGMLPIPKYDENQDHYIGPCTDRLTFVPVTVQNLDRTGVLLEALNYNGYRYVLPTYRDSTLKGRYASNEDTANMLDIIYSNRVISLSYLYGNMSLDLIKSTVPNGDVASFVEKKSSGELKTIAKLVEQHQ